MNKNGDTFYGKYRGVVTNNQDPLQIARIRASVPDVYGDLESGWAMPAAPFGGDGLGFFAVPSEGAGVWIEFECGDPDYPIWTGSWWGSVREMPSVLFAPPPPSGTDPKVLIKTKGGHSILLDDSPGQGGITLETSGGQKIVLNSQGIEITNGQGASIKLSGPTVKINDQALEVT
jgi:uncharacterized protein involved in type VI secretion and phage assembly